MKIKYQRLILAILRSFDEEIIQKLSLRIIYGNNIYNIKLSNSLVYCKVMNQPTELELDIFRFGVTGDISCDVNLKDAILFSIISKDHKITGHKRLIVSMTDTPMNESFIIVNGNNSYTINHNYRIPTRVYKYVTKQMNSGRLDLPEYMAESYFSDFNTAYNSRMRAFLRMASKCETFQFVENKNVIFSIGASNMIYCCRYSKTAKKLCKIASLYFFD